MSNLVSYARSPQGWAEATPFQPWNPPLALCNVQYRVATDGTVFAESNEPGRFPAYYKWTKEEFEATKSQKHQDIENPVHGWI